MRPPGGEAHQPTVAGQFATAPDDRNGFQPYVGKSATEYPIGTPRTEPRQPAYTIERKKKPADGEKSFMLTSFPNHSSLLPFISLSLSLSHSLSLSLSLSLSGQPPALALCSGFDTAGNTPSEMVPTSSARWNGSAAAAAAEAKSTG
jgi:hypothetical protein